MDLPSISPTASPLRIASHDYKAIDQLAVYLETASKKGFTSQAQTLNQTLRSQIAALHLPYCFIQYVAWMQPVAGSLQELQCVQLLFFAPSLPPPQKLWNINLPEKILAKGIFDDDVKDWLREAFAAPCIVSASRGEGYGFKAHNWEPALQTLEQINLNEKGKPLANEWLHALQKAEPTSETAYNHFKNLSFLLHTLAEKKICSFTEEEFAPFLETMSLGASILAKWRKNQFIRPNS